MENKDIKKNILCFSAVLLICFLCLMGNIFYLQVWKADDLAGNHFNSRNNIGDTVLRGAILDAYGETLAYSPEKGMREYPYGKAAAPVTGYLSDIFGSFALEQQFGYELSGQKLSINRLGPVAQLFKSDKGNNLKLTLDAELQELAYEELADRNGAIVMLDAETGGIIVMASTPSYDPATVTENWSDLSNSKDAVLLNRVTQGLYPPGSTIKLLIADAAIDSKIISEDEKFKCDGIFNVGDTYIKESHDAVHGDINLKDALAYSCNITFANLAMNLQANGLADAFERFGFDRELDAQISDAKPYLPDFHNIWKGDMAQVGIGQGELLVSPLRMALLASAYINNGNIMKPYLVDEVISPEGSVIFKEKHEKWLTVTSQHRANLIHSFMENIVDNGTGGEAFVRGCHVSGKTGTAENVSGEDHGWFIGVAEVNGRKLAFAIIVENSGGGGTVAAPIARDMIVSFRDR